MNDQHRERRLFLYRLTIILIVYLLVITTGIILGHRINHAISPEVFQNPTLSIQTYLDDFIRVRISCDWTNKTINLVVKDEFGNIRHNSTSVISCQGYKTLDLQGQPQDYEKDRRYMVEATFDNQTISTSYFYLISPSWEDLVKKEASSFGMFMIYQSRLARGAYSDDQRLLYIETRNPAYAEGFIKAHALGIISTFTTFFVIDIGIWIFIFIRRYVFRKKELLS